MSTETITESGLSAKLAQWLAEFREVGGIDEKLPGFLARRIVESGLTTVELDPDVMQARIGGQVRNVRVRGQQRATPHIMYEELDATRGMGILPAREFVDQQRLVECLKRMNTTTVGG